MIQKAKKRTQQKKGPRRGEPGYAEWCRNIARGMRRERIRRRDAGLLTLRQAAVKYVLPLSFVKKKIAEGEVRILQAGSVVYIRDAEAERVFGS
jgi:hypothetical protein